MEIADLHPWNLSPGAAAAVQRSLAGRVRLLPLSRPVRVLAGADVAFLPLRNLVLAAVVTLSWPGLSLLETATAVRPGLFPYVPGLLSFREGPALLAAFASLTGPPDLILLDGQGIAHPRRLGLASHLGLILDLPAIGCAKSRLLGTADPPGPLRGSASPLRDGGEVVGMVLRTRDRVAPLYVSPGHLTNLDDAVRWTLAAGGGFRLPEPTRLAHQAVSRLKRALPAEEAS
jgi:deoxyribonuclease V